MQLTHRRKRQGYKALHPLDCINAGETGTARLRVSSTTPHGLHIYIYRNVASIKKRKICFMAATECRAKTRRKATCSVGIMKKKKQKQTVVSSKQIQGCTGTHFSPANKIQGCTGTHFSRRRRAYCSRLRYTIRTHASSHPFPITAHLCSQNTQQEADTTTTTVVSDTYGSKTQESRSRLGFFSREGMRSTLNSSGKTAPFLVSLLISNSACLS